MISTPFGTPVEPDVKIAYRGSTSSNTLDDKAKNKFKFHHISTDEVYGDLNGPEDFFREITERTVSTAKKHGKISERWLMGYYKQPKDWAQVARWADIAEQAGVDRLSAWTYRGGYGTVVGAPDALKLWDTIGENYKRVLGKQ